MGARFSAMCTTINSCGKYLHPRAPERSLSKGLHGVQIGLHGRCFALSSMVAHPHKKEATASGAFLFGSSRHVLEILLFNEIKKQCHRDESTASVNIYCPVPALCGTRMSAKIHFTGSFGMGG